MSVQFWSCNFFGGGKIFFSTLCLYVIACRLCDAQCPSDCLCNWKRVNCDRAGIHDVPSEIPTKANILLLSNNFIDVINEETLQNMQDILEMQLEGNVIQWIPPNTFSHCSKLVKLNISNNRIPALQNEAFVGLDKLEVLDLSGNNINEIHPHALRPLESLNELNLCDNSLRQLTEGIFRNFKHLRRLNLGKSKINLSSSKIFRGLGNLTWLNLGENAKLNSIPNGMFYELPSLKFLDLQGCGFETLSPSMFEGLSVLEEINLQGNKLRNTLPLQLFGNIPNLISLNIGNNYLMTLHESVLSSNKHLTKVLLNGNNWQCSCGLLNVRAQWPYGKPTFMQEGLTCKGPVTLKPPRDLWNIPLKDLQDQCIVEINNAKMLRLPNNYSDALYLECPVPQTGISTVDWITPDGQYVAGKSPQDRYILFDNGTLYMGKAQSGSYMCSVTAPTGESSRAFLRVTFSDAVYGQPPITPSPIDPKENSNVQHSNGKAFLVSAIIIIIIFIIAVIVVWLRCKRAKRADKPFYSPYQHPEHVKNMDHPYAYAYISVPEGKAKKKRDISAYAINALFEFKLPNLPEFDKGYGYDHIKGVRPKSHSCRERTSKYTPEPIPRPSHTLDSRDSRGTSRAESCIYVTPANGGGIGMFFSANTKDRSSDQDDMGIPLYGITRMNDNDDLHEKGLKSLRELQSKTYNGSIRPKSNPYIELIA